MGTPPWMRVNKEVFNVNKEGSKSAIAIGMLGLDLVHSAQTELHPVHALAIRVNDNPSDETWAIFVRNWGNEGQCGKAQVILDTDTVIFDLPWREGMQDVMVTERTFHTNSRQAEGPWVEPVAGGAVRVIFKLPPPGPAQERLRQLQARGCGLSTRRQPGCPTLQDYFDALKDTRPLIDGELHLAWSGQAPARSPG